MLKTSKLTNLIFVSHLWSFSNSLADWDALEFKSCERMFLLTVKVRKKKVIFDFAFSFLVQTTITKYLKFPATRRNSAVSFQINIAVLPVIYTSEKPKCYQFGFFWNIIT